MSRTTCQISVSLDGFAAGPNQSLDNPLGEGGDRLHEWAFPPEGRRGEPVDAQIQAKWSEGVGAFVMGRKMFGGDAGDGTWVPDWHGWWGEDPPYHAPVYVLTHHEREPLELEGTTFQFVQSFDEALERAKAAAGEKDIQIHGGGEAVQAAIAAGALDELNTHIAPIMLGSGSPLLAGSTGRLERVRVIESPTGVTHIRYRVLK